MVEFRVVVLYVVVNVSVVVLSGFDVEVVVSFVDVTLVVFLGSLLDDVGFFTLFLAAFSISLIFF